MESILITAQKADFCARVGEKSGQEVTRCYQCGKCTAGCPLVGAMDLPPSQVMRMVQFNMENEVLTSQAIWLCAYCSTCTVRCPRQISVADVMDTLRIMAGQKGVAGSGKGRNVAIFNGSFLETIKRFGRLYEFGAMLLFNLKSGRPWQNAGLGLKMLQRGKLKLAIGRIKGIREIERIFEQTNRLLREEQKAVRKGVANP